jgi:hypothetical protein
VALCELDTVGWLAGQTAKIAELEQARQHTKDILEDCRAGHCRLIAWLSWRPHRT